MVNLNGESEDFAGRVEGVSLWVKQSKEPRTTQQCSRGSQITNNLITPFQKARENGGWMRLWHGTDWLCHKALGFSQPRPSFRSGQNDCGLRERKRQILKRWCYNWPYSTENSTKGKERRPRGLRKSIEVEFGQGWSPESSFTIRTLLLALSKKKVSIWTNI
jgi:hypothetical protein